MVDLRSLWSIATIRVQRTVVLVIHQGERKQCLMVDEIVDQRPVVIKLDENFVKYLMSGATIMGDGKVSFILDVATVMN